MEMRMAWWMGDEDGQRGDGDGGGCFLDGIPMPSVFLYQWFNQIEIQEKAYRLQKSTMVQAMTMTNGWVQRQERGQERERWMMMPK